MTFARWIRMQISGLCLLVFVVVTVELTSRYLGPEWFLPPHDPALLVRTNVLIGMALASSSLVLSLFTGLVPRSFALAIAGILLLVGLASSIEHLTGLNFGLDTALHPFFREGFAAHFYEAFPDRPPPTMSVMMLCLGVFLILCVKPSESRYKISLARLLAVVIVAEASIGLFVCRGSGADFVLGAIQCSKGGWSSLAYFAWTLGALLPRAFLPPLSLKSRRSLLLPLVACYVITLVSIGLSLGVSRMHDRDLGDATEQFARSMASQIEKDLRDRIHEFYLLVTPTGRDLALGPMFDQPGWTSMLGLVGVKVAGVIDGQCHLTRAWPDDITGAERDILVKTGREACRKFFSRGSFPLEGGCVYGPYDIGGEEFVAIAVDDHNDEDSGSLVGLVRFSSFVLLRSDDYLVYVDGLADLPGSEPDAAHRLAKSAEVNLEGLSLSVAAIPKVSRLVAAASPMPTAVSAVGCLLALAIGMSLFSRGLAVEAGDDLEEALSWQKAVADGSPLMIISVDAEGRVRTMNPAAERGLGYRESELKGTENPFLWMDVGEFSSEMTKLGLVDVGASEKELFEAFAAYLTAEGSWLRAGTYLTKKGDQVPVRVVAHSIKDKSGHLIGIVSVAQDLTGEKAREIVMQEYREKMLASNRLAALGEMAGSIAHEVNNPVFAIRGRIAQILKLKARGDLSDENLKSYLLSIDDMTDRMGKVVKNILSLATGKEKEPRVFVTARSVVDGAVSFCEHKFIHLGVPLRQKWDASGTIEINCIPVQIGQILTNLLGNALDAVAPLEEKWVEIEVGEDADSVVFKVTDSGGGIEPETAAKIMEAFYTTKPPGKGNGLGLAISTKIAREHGGKLELDMECAHTCFVLTLPKASHTEESLQKA